MSTHRKKRLGFRVYRYNKVRTTCLDDNVDSDDEDEGMLCFVLNCRQMTIETMIYCLLSDSLHVPYALSTSDVCC